MSSSKISSLQIIGSKSLGGAERFYCRMINALTKKNEKVAACFPVKSMIEAELAQNVISFPAHMRSVYDPFSRRSLSNVIKRFKPDIVMTFMGRATRLVRLKKNNSPVHVARLGGYYNLKGYKHAHAWVGNTKGICDYLTNAGLPRDKVFHVSNFVDIPDRIKNEEILQFKRENNIPHEALIVSTVARLHPNKGIKDLIKAFSLLPKEIEDKRIYLLIAGDGDLKKSLQQFADSLGVNERIVWLGWMLAPDIVYQSSKVFVCPSVHEPLGNVILEAWSQQVPLVSTKTFGAMELMENETTGLMVDITDAVTMADSILRLLQASKSDNDYLVNNGLEVLKNKFSQDKILGEYLDVYRELLIRQ